MKIKKIVSIIFYILAVIFVAIYGFSEIAPHLMMSEMARLFLLGGSCLFLYFGGLIKSKIENNNKAMKINLWIFFVLYLVLLITLTLFDPMWGRNSFDLFNWNGEYIDIYLESSLNLVPFKTIIGYAKDLFVSLLDTSTIFLNLFGNLICLMPMALFISMLFKKVNNTKKFLISILAITLAIELMQLITFSGSCDIDDIILNTLGAFIAYLILNVKDIKNLVRNILLLEKNEINKKKLIWIIVPIIVVICLCLGLYKIGERNYDKNLEDWTSKRNYKLEIIDESEVTAQALEKFYETELYEYYFSSIKSDYVYAKINDGEKYLVKDLLNNNPTDYIISIDRFKRAGLEFIEKEKYDKIELKIQGSVYIGKEKIQDESILNIGWGTSEQGLSELSQEVFLIPKKEGKTTLTFEVYNSKTSELVKTIIYEINITSDLKVSYEEIK